MKLNLPVFIGAAVIVTGLGVLLLWEPEPTARELTAPSAQRIRGELRDNPEFRNRGLIEGRDYIVEEPAILSRADEEMIVRIDVKFPNRPAESIYHRYVRRDKGWEIERDLNLDFAEFVKKETKAACDRLGKRLAERYQDKVDIPAENVRIGQRLRATPTAGSTEPRVIGSLEVHYLDAGGEGRYVEDFAFANGAWSLEGKAGSLFDRGPRPPGAKSP